MDGRDAVRLKSGRVVWRDGMRDEWGGFIAGLRPWSLFGTFTYDQDARADWLATLRKSPGLRDAGALVVPLDTAEHHFRRQADYMASALGHRVEYVSALEFQKNGWPHHHALLDTGEVHAGDLDVLSRWWRKNCGFVRLEIPRSLHDVCGYAAKYLSKDVERGRVLLSTGLAASAEYQSRARDAMRSYYR